MDGNKRLERLDEDIRIAVELACKAWEDYDTAPEGSEQQKRRYERWKEQKEAHERLEARRKELEDLLLDPGKQTAEGTLALMAEETRALWRELREQKILNNKYLQTSRTDQAVGELYQKMMKTTTDIKFLTPMSERDPRVKLACDAVLKEFGRDTPGDGRIFVNPDSRARKRPCLDQEDEAGVQQGGNASRVEASNTMSARLPGTSLLDLIGPDTKIDEKKHMQPTVLRVLRAAASSLGTDYHIEDTHDNSRKMIAPNHQPDATALAEQGSRSWANAVCTFEFKLLDSLPQISAAIGQTIKSTRYIFEGQGEERQHAMAVILTLNSLELLWIQKGEHGEMNVYTTGQQSFSMSPDSPGFRWLVRLLATRHHELGFRKPAMPELQHVGGVAVHGLQLIRRGTGHGSGSFVWACETNTGKAILKLNHDPLEANLLERLRGSAHVVQLIARDSCMYLGSSWHVVLLHPVVKLLTQEDPLRLVCQVAHDVAEGISECAQRGVAQRDTTENNIGYDESERGFLFDFSAGKFVESHDWTSAQTSDSPRSNDILNITGTLTAAPVSVLLGQPHTVSSMLEGVFHSVCNVACDSKVPRLLIGCDRALDWGAQRAGTLLQRELPQRSTFPAALLPLIDGLHNLFFPLGEGFFRGYRVDVTVAEFQAACHSACEGELKPCRS